MANSGNFCSGYFPLSLVQQNAPIKYQFIVAKTHVHKVHVTKYMLYVRKGLQNGPNRYEMKDIGTEKTEIKRTFTEDIRLLA